MEDGKLWEVMEKEAIGGYQQLLIPRQKNRSARKATLEVRWREVELQAPRTSHLPSVKAWAVYALEKEFANPVEWLLLTTVPVNSFERACEVLGWYAKRWGIEIYHRTLKSGCQIEERQLGRVDRLESCLAIDLVVAWRIYYLTESQALKQRGEDCSVSMTSQPPGRSL